ncbi:hypothetical protein [uncultured Clostridium sp.]|uniref:hypothetical protein n=1 Tax=uncultured Clostridium sp. TaxID=59620 RepID=UPI0026388D7A|nr:hypothetical protein [uncultured Clostridium sp.]
MLELIYSYYKSAFNDRYSINIKGVPVELYIEDKNTSAISNGIYSVQNNEWIKKPSVIEKQDVDISKPLEYMIRRFEEVKLLEDPITAQTLLDLLYANRQRSLAVEGEYGVDNLIFKEFRNRGFIQEIKDIIRNGESRELSLENLSKIFNEAYLDPEKKFFDYGTDEVEEYNPKNLFTLNKTGMSFYDNFLNDKELKYMQKNKGLDGEIIYMTPGEYFQKSAKIRGLDPERLYNNIIKDEGSMDDLRTVVKKYKRRLNLPFLNLSEGDYGPGQEGNHRMALAAEMFGWNEKFPVLVVTTYLGN